MKIRPITQGEDSMLFDLAKQGEPGIRANNHMIYFLATSILNRYVFIGEHKGENIGYIFAIKDSSKPSVWLHQLVVTENHRNKGYGRQFLQFLKQEVHKDGIHSIELMVKPENPAKQLYASCGFQEIELNENLNMLLYRLLTA